MTSKTFNFCAGPAALPKPVMARAQQELLDWQGLGVSVMEVSHRSAEYQALAKRAEADFRALLKIPNDYEVLFLHGGATLQFSLIPMCLLANGGTAEYLVDGVWSKKAAAEASRYGTAESVELVSELDGINQIRPLSQWQRVEDPVYTHYTPNETIEGIRIGDKIESTGAIIADMSSCILSEQINVADFDMIYAGAQKNIGPAGMTIVIIKQQLLAKMQFDKTPKVFNYLAQAEQGSMVNTPPTYTWYLASLVFEWIKEQGGVASMETAAIKRAETLYQYIDNDNFYRNPVAVKDRSRMNVPFTLADPSLDPVFLEEAKSHQLLGLKGHRSTGGMRASLYNSMTQEGVDSLIAFMQSFKKKHGV